MVPTAVATVAEMEEVVVETEDQALQTVALGGGCFWCMDAVFSEVRGIHSIECGYSNGHAVAPSYELVCTGQSGHAEVLLLTFDPAQVGLRELLEVFFLVHDPTTLNRQGHDVGTQYRSGIYTTATEQVAVARDVIAEVQAHVGAQRPVVTEVLPLANYTRAEEYHQNFFAKNPTQGYCLAVAAPKVAKFRQTLGRLQKDRT